MVPKKLTIRITNEAIHFSPEIMISIRHSDIPWKHLSFNTQKDIWWRVEQVKAKDGTLYLSIIDYYAELADDYQNRPPLKSEFIKVEFGKLDWGELKGLLDSCNIRKLEPSLYNTQDYILSESSYNQVAKLNEISPDYLAPMTFSPFSENITVPWDQIQIGEGKVYFEWLVKKRGFNDKITIEVVNPILKKEFDSIKSWLARKVGSKIEVNANYRTSATKIINVEATSENIDSITPEFIDLIKSKRTKALFREQTLTNPGVTLWEIDGLFDIVHSDKDSNIFHQTDEDLLNYCFDVKKVRNQRQLEYLSKEKQDGSNKLKYTLAPHFGFVFYVEGQHNSHFIWELLNSNATYIWSINKGFLPIFEQFKRVETAINHIVASGREPYKQNYKNGEVDSDISFTPISHLKTTSASLEGFELWKKHLNSIIQ